MTVVNSLVVSQADNSYLIDRSILYYGTQRFIIVFTKAYYWCLLSSQLNPLSVFIIYFVRYSSKPPIQWVPGALSQRLKQLKHHNHFISPLYHCSSFTGCDGSTTYSSAHRIHTDGSTPLVQIAASTNPLG
jgi:hypothetical protein